MRRSMAIAFTTATVAGIMLAPTAAFAASDGSVARQIGHSASRWNVEAGFDPSTTVTFAITSGALTMTVPGAANLGSTAPGVDISAQLGAVSVQDNRALLTAAWTVTAADSAFTTGTATPAETIPASALSYSPGSITTSGTITATGTNITMSGTPATVVAGSSGVGNNSAAWNPTITVDVPASAVFGTYTGTVTHSVS
jgi:hypothetical protein